MAVLHMKLVDHISQPLDNEFSAVVAIGVASAVSGHIPDIDIANSLFHGQIPEIFKEFDRGRGQASQFVERGEPGEM